MAKTIFYSLAALVRKVLFCHSKIKFISSRHRVISSIYIYVFPLPLIYLSEFVVLISVLALKKEFKDKRKKHYKEYCKVKLARKLIEQELNDLEDDNDSVENNTKEAPSSSQDGADIQVIKSICSNNQTSWRFSGDK